MAILVDRSTRVLVQGITGREGSFHTQQMQAYGTTVVAGVVPGRGGAEALGVPVFDTVAAAVAATGADTAFTIVPPAFAADAVMEAAAAGLRLGVCVTEGIPVLDMVRAAAFVQRTAMRLIGPNCPGLMTPGEAKIGFIPNHVGRPGRVGVVARSGTLTYEVIQGLSDAGHGETTAVGIGGDPVLGSTFVDILPLFAADPATEAVVLVGEIGGSDEERAAEWIRASPASTSRWSPSSAAGPLPRASGWAMPGRSSAGPPGRPRARSTRSPPRAPRWPAPSRTWSGWSGSGSPVPSAPTWKPPPGAPAGSRSGPERRGLRV